MNHYSYQQVDNLIERYTNKGGEALQTSEGVLGSGDWLLYDFGGKLKFIVIREIYLNSWSSAHTVRMYNRIPKKYQKILNEHGC